jgi:folylpolyglutamate synthase/dihydropteroate synthase
MSDKDYPRMLRVLAPLFARILYCPPSMNRAVSHRELAAVVPGSRTRGVADALRQAKKAAGPRGEVVVTGSIFLLAETRKHLLGLRTDPLIRM